jgi:hypothetical protein
MPRQPFNLFPPAFRRATGVLALALFCWLNALAVVPHLHFGACGQDAQSEQHQCAVTLLTKHQLDTALPAFEVPPPVLTFAAPLPSLSLPRVAADHSLPAGRAPPRLLA